MRRLFVRATAHMLHKALASATQRVAAPAEHCAHAWRQLSLLLGLCRCDSSSSITARLAATLRNELVYVLFLPEVSCAVLACAISASRADVSPSALAVHCYNMYMELLTLLHAALCAC